MQSQLAALMQPPPIYIPQMGVGADNLGITELQGKNYFSGALCDYLLTLIFGPANWGVVDARTGRLDVDVSWGKHKTKKGAEMISARVRIGLWARMRSESGRTAWLYAAAEAADDKQNNSDGVGFARSGAESRAKKKAATNFGSVFGRLALIGGTFGYRNAVALAGSPGDSRPHLGVPFNHLSWPDPKDWWEPRTELEERCTFTGLHPHLFGGSWAPEAEPFRMGPIPAAFEVSPDDPQLYPEPELEPEPEMSAPASEAAPTPARADQGGDPGLGARVAFLAAKFPEALAEAARAWDGSPELAGNVAKTRAVLSLFDGVDFEQGPEAVHDAIRAKLARLKAPVDPA